MGITGHATDIPEIDQKVRDKIVSLFKDHGVARQDIKERFRISITTVNKVLREAGVRVQ